MYSGLTSLWQTYRLGLPEVPGTHEAIKTQQLNSNTNPQYPTTTLDVAFIHIFHQHVHWQQAIVDVSP